VQQVCDKDGTTMRKGSKGWDTRTNVRLSIAMALFVSQTLRHGRAGGLALRQPTRYVPAAAARF